MKKPIFRLILAVLLTVAMLTELAGCNGIGTTTTIQDDSLQKILDAGQLVLGLDMAFPPLGFVDENGDTVGFDIDMAQEVCNRLGIKLVLREIDWNKKDDDLNEGRIDCIWNGMSYTVQRDESMCLSEPYMRNELIVVVPCDSNIKKMSDLSGITIGVQAGATSEDVLKASGFHKNVDVVSFKTAQELLEELKKGKMDAALVDSVTAYYFIFSSVETYYILSDSLGEEEYVIGFRKNDVKLCEKVQEIIGQMKADGTLGEISKKWFGSDITIVK